MAKRARCDANERIKMQHQQWLKYAGRLSEKSIDKSAAAIERFDAWNGRKDFRRFRVEQAMAYRDHLEMEVNPNTGKPLSKGTLAALLMPLHRLIIWLADQPGYEGIRYSHAEYFNLSYRDRRIARSGRPKRAPSADQARHVLASMPRNTVIEKRDASLVALLLLTGARVGAIIGLRNRHLDTAGKTLWQDANDVAVKFGKSQETTFFQGFPEAEEVLAEWQRVQREELLRGPDDPLFPRTLSGRDQNGAFGAMGLDLEPWSGPSGVRRIVKLAFQNAGYPGYGPHAFRHMHARRDLENMTIARFKAISENLGHEGMLTTLRSYSQLSSEKRRALILESSD